MGKTRRARHRNDCLGLSRLLPASRRCRPAVAVISPHLPGPCKTSDCCSSTCPISRSHRRLKSASAPPTRVEDRGARRRRTQTSLPSRGGVQQLPEMSQYQIILVFEPYL